mmetsp:Transcript_94503/g.163963  ORF Transcript_94503/g.163963 Transcript_94503/m.163963 type:complete len:87 (+) Transcript_94503:68-328(+)
MHTSHLANTNAEKIQAPSLSLKRYSMHELQTSCQAGSLAVAKPEAESANVQHCTVLKNVFKSSLPCRLQKLKWSHLHACLDFGLDE